MHLTDHSRKSTAAYHCLTRMSPTLQYSFQNSTYSWSSFRQYELTTMQLNLHHHQLNSSMNAISLIFMLNIKPHDTTLLVEDSYNYILTCLFLQTKAHIYIATLMFLMHTIKISLQNSPTFSLRCLQCIINTCTSISNCSILNYPSLSDLASQFGRPPAVSTNKTRRPINRNWKHSRRRRIFPHTMLQSEQSYNRSWSASGRLVGLS